MRVRESRVSVHTEFFILVFSFIFVKSIVFFSCFMIVTPEAIGLLENKLKKTMNDYANLYDEKQRLEHLVLHLQSETETIGN